MSLLAEPRTRSILFAVGALALLGVVAWAMFTRGDAPLPDAAPSSAATSAVVPYAPPVPEPSPISSESPAPTATASPQTSPTKSSEPVEWTERDVTTYLKAFNTFNWQESEQVFIDRVIKAGAVPGSRAAAYPYTGGLLAACQRRYCSTEFLSADRIEAGDRAQVKAKAKVKFTDYGKSQAQVLSCTLTLATGSDTKRGMFTDVFCLGPNG